MQSPWTFAKTYARAVLRSSSLLTLDVLSRQGRSRLHHFANLGGMAGSKPALPDTTLAELGVAHLPFELREIEAGDGNVTVTELATISALAHLHRPEVVFEIGTFDGRTTLNLAANSPPGAKVYTLDLPRADLASVRHTLDEHDIKYIEKAVSGNRFLSDKTAGPAAKITQLWGDSGTFDFSPYLSEIDLIFIDGSHAYDYVLSDSRNAIRLLRGGLGLIVWHDYNSPWWPGVTRALNELYASGAPFDRIRHIRGTTMAVLVAT